MSTTVLITGANRGLGLGLAQAYAAMPNYTVFATARDVSSMPEVKTAEGSKIFTIQYDAAGKTAHQDMIEQVKKQGVTKLDIVIANSAIMKPEVWAPLAEVSADVFEDHWRINVLGTLLVFQACVPLMSKGGKFIFMSSGASIIDRVPDKIDATYGITKCNNNYLARYTHFENPDLIIFPLSPGWVQTDMGNRAAKLSGVEKAAITTEVSVEGMMKVIGGATRESCGGKHMRYDGSESKW